ncbi:hypothetical protein E3P98_00167 [Wallemia ichthyophaga]|nr:hypothetical protein E3P98_00167 [Wallemia ichthyophaga]
MPNPTQQSYRIRNWEIKTQKSTIPSMPESDALAAELGIPIPEMTFLSSGVEVLDTDSGFKLSFNARDALRGVSKQNELRVSYADHWRSSRQPHEASTIQPSQPWDWTYSTTYSGSTESERAHWQPIPTTTPVIPIDKLSDTTQPILFYDDVQLYEDELGDNGQVGLNVKIRVMPFAWFILQRFFLRVDDVLFRMYDVRVYHDFSGNVVSRECAGWEAGWEAMKQCLPPHTPNILSDEPVIQATLRTMEKYNTHTNCTQWKGLGYVKEVCEL